MVEFLLIVDELHLKVAGTKMNRDRQQRGGVPVAGRRNVNVMSCHNHEGWKSDLTSHYKGSISDVT